MEELVFSMNTMWVLIAAALVFFMQAGFALVEMGMTRAKNATNILMKNLMDYVPLLFGLLVLESCLVRLMAGGVV